MNTNSTSAEDRFAKLGVRLPEAPSPFGAYVPAIQTGNLLFLSGMLATVGHTPAIAGIVGKDLDVSAGQKAAHAAALNVLALTKKQLGSLNRVAQFVRLSVFVAATAEFTEHAKVADERRNSCARSSAKTRFRRVWSSVSRVFRSARRSSWKSSWK